MREKYIRFRHSGFFDWTCTTTIAPEGWTWSGLKITYKKKYSVSIDDYLTDTWYNSVLNHLHEGTRLTRTGCCEPEVR